MKVALVTDTHFGARSDSIQFDEFFSSFYRDIFFPSLKEQGIKTIVHLGDVFDRRKFVNFVTLKRCKEYFFQTALNEGIDVIILIGNHDTFYKNTNDVNSVELLLQEYPNIQIHSSPTHIVLGKRKILLLPWICQANHEESMKLLDTTDAHVCFGHLELEGFQMFKGQINDHGDDITPFKKFDLVCSGHFHHRNTKDNIVYLGNPYEITWSDYDDLRGFHIYDTYSNELTFIPNTRKMFHKIFYDDTSDVNYDVYLDDAKSTCIKIIVVKKTDHQAFERWLERMYLQNPIEIRVIEDMKQLDEGTIEEDINVEDTMSILTTYIDSIETNLDKVRLKKLFQSLYVEAQNYTP